MSAPPVVRWTFEDLATGDSYEWEVNPNSGGSPQYRKTITYQHTLGGRTLIFEGADEPLTGQISGTLLSQTQHETLVDWWDKRHLIRLTDDLGRTYMIYIVSYEPERQRSVQYGYKHSYTMTYTIVG